MSGNGIWISKQVIWTVVPCGEHWEVRKDWRYRTRYDEPDDVWKREYAKTFHTLDEAVLAVAADYRENATVARSLQIKLGQATLNGDDTLRHKKQR